MFKNDLHCAARTNGLEYCRKNQGHTDIELNQRGIAQARELARKLEKTRFDLVISSPLKRAIQTAEIIRPGPILCDERIKERFNGELEGRTDAAKLVDFSDPKDTRYGIETLPLFRKRIREFWDEILQKHKGKNLLVVMGDVLNGEITKTE